MIWARDAALAADFVADVDVVGAETARAAVDEDADDGDAALPLPPLRGEATAEAGLAQAVLRDDDDDALRRATTGVEERSDVLADSIFVSFLVRFLREHCRRVKSGKCGK